MSKTHIAIVLDMSGSMDRTVEATKAGVVEYIKSTRKEIPDARFTLNIFDDKFEKWIDDVELGSVRAKAAIRNYRPRGWTALYDAIGKTAHELEGKIGRKDKAIVVIMTDGYENRSKEYTASGIRNLIDRLQGKGNWTFVFLGANIDSWGVGQQLGFHRGNVVDYAYGQGQFRAFAGTAKATSTLARSANLSSHSTYESAGVATQDWANEETFDVDLINKTIKSGDKSDSTS